MISPDTWLWLWYERVISFLYILMKGKESCDDNISCSCSFHHPGIIFSGMSCIHNNKENCDMKVHYKNNPGHITILCVCRLSSRCFSTSGRVILPFLSIFPRVKENSLLLPHSHVPLLTFSPAALPTSWLTVRESLFSNFPHIRSWAYAFEKRIKTRSNKNKMFSELIISDKLNLTLTPEKVGQLQLFWKKTNKRKHILNDSCTFCCLNSSQTW